MARIPDLDTIDIVNGTDFTICVDLASPICQQRLAEHGVRMLLPNRVQFVASLWNKLHWAVLSSQAESSLPRGSIACLVESSHYRNITSGIGKAKSNRQVGKETASIAELARRLEIASA